MAQLEDFVDGISVHLGNSDASNVPRIAIVFAARQALKRFCDESYAYIVNAFDPLVETDRATTESDLSLTRNDRHCQLDLPEHTHIIKVWRLTNDDCEHYNQLGGAIHTYPDTINLDNKDSRADNIVVSLSVGQATEELPDYIFNRYYDGLLAGTIGYLQMMPSKEWSMPNMVQDHFALFDQSIKKAKTDVSSGFLKSRPMSTVPGNFI